MTNSTSWSCCQSVAAKPPASPHPASNASSTEHQQTPPPSRRWPNERLPHPRRRDEGGRGGDGQENPLDVHGAACAAGVRTTSGVESSRPSGSQYRAHTGRPPQRLVSTLRLARRSKHRTDRRSDDHADRNTDPNGKSHQLHIVHDALPCFGTHRPEFRGPRLTGSRSLRTLPLSTVR